MQNADDLGLDIGHAVEGIEEEAAGSVVQRERHGVDGEVAAAQVIVDSGGRDYGRLARLFKALGARHADFGAGVARQRNENRPHVRFDRGNFRAGFFQIFLQLESIALDGEVQIADGESADHVTDGAAREVKIHAGGAGYVLHQPDALELVRGQPDFHRVNVVSHSLSSARQTPIPGAIRSAIATRERVRRANFPQDFHSLASTYPLAPQPPGCKWLNSKYLCEVETLRQAKENNTTFTFWLLPRRIPVVSGKKVRESQRLDRKSTR